MLAVGLAGVLFGRFEGMIRNAVCLFGVVLHVVRWVHELQIDGELACLVATSLLWNGTH